MIVFLQANVGLAIVLALFSGSNLVLCLSGLLMKRAGVFLKPLWWFAGFMLLILLPQLAGQLVNAYMKDPALPMPSPADKEPRGAEPAKSPADLDYSDPEKLFGRRSAGVLVVDGRATASGLLHAAENPKFFILNGQRDLYPRSICANACSGSTRSICPFE